MPYLFNDWLKDLMYGYEDEVVEDFEIVLPQLTDPPEIKVVVYCASGKRLEYVKSLVERMPVKGSTVKEKL